MVVHSEKTPDQLLESGPAVPVPWQYLAHGTLNIKQRLCHIFSYRLSIPASNIYQWEWNTMVSPPLLLKDAIVLASKELC